MRKTLALAVALGLGSSAQAAEPANTLAAMFAQLNRCLASVELAPGVDVTVQFSLNRRGGLIGKPRLTHAHWPEGADATQTAADISAGFDRCLPAAITDALGGAIAGRLIAYRLRGPAAKA
jgi:hypothetical protein